MKSSQNTKYHCIKTGHPGISAPRRPPDNALKAVNESSDSLSRAIISRVNSHCLSFSHPLLSSSLLQQQSVHAIRPPQGIAWLDRCNLFRQLWAVLFFFSSPPRSDCSQMPSELQLDFSSCKVYVFFFFFFLPFFYISYVYTLFFLSTTHTPCGWMSEQPWLSFGREGLGPRIGGSTRGLRCCSFSLNKVYSPSSFLL